MPITGGTNWTNQVNAQYKRPLYTLELILYQGTVNVAGTAVSLVSGDPFLGTWANVPIIINGKAAVVSFVSSGTSLTLTGSLGTLTGVAYQFPLLIVSTFLPGDIANPPQGMAPYLFIPQGAGQSVTELDGHSSISDLTAECIDPAGVVKAAVATGVLGLTAFLKSGFPTLDYSEFVVIHAGMVTDTGYSPDGKINVTVTDNQKQIVDKIWLNGGPGFTGTVNTSGTVNVVRASGDFFVTGEAWKGQTIYIGGNPYTIASVTDENNLVTTAAVGVGTGLTYIVPLDNEPQFFSFTDDTIAISGDNPRYVYGHPLDILLVAMQNELGIGQDPSLPPPLELLDDGTGGSMEAVFAPNPSWQKYVPGNDATLINPNPYLDVPGVLALRDGQYAAEKMLFRLTRADTGKTWIEDQILKPLGLFWIARANGQLTLKSMKRPLTITTTAVTDHQIIGIPEISRFPIVNYETVRAQVDNSVRESAARQYAFDQTYVNLNSITKYRQQYQSSIESDGLRSALGCGARAFLTVNRIFNRHAFGTPVYKWTSFFKTLTLEIGDFVLLSHTKLLDSLTGTLGVSNVICEVIDRQPNYAEGTMDYQVIDTRFINMPPQFYKVVGSFKGTVNVSGTAVARVSGDAFDASGAWNGRRILLNDIVLGVVNHVVDANNLVLNASAGTLSAVNYVVAKLNDYATAAAPDQSAYMFIANNSGKYSTGAAGNVIF